MISIMKKMAYESNVRLELMLRDQSKFTRYLGQILGKIYLKKVPFFLSKNIYAPCVWPQARHLINFPLIYFIYLFIYVALWKHDNHFSDLEALRTGTFVSWK